MSGIGHPQKLILLVSRGLCFEREMFGAGREQIMLELRSRARVLQDFREHGLVSERQIVLFIVVVSKCH